MGEIRRSRTAEGGGKKSADEYEADSEKDLSGLKAALATWEGRMPNVWKESGGLIQAYASTAAASGDRNMVLFFVEEMGVPVNDAPAPASSDIAAAERRTDGLMTPLVSATIKLHEDLALDLLAMPGQGDLDLERRFPNGQNILMYAAYSGQACLVQELLVRGADLDARNGKGHSALCMAALNVLLEEYRARGRLQEAMESPCRLDDGSPSPLLHHATDIAGSEPETVAAQLSIVR